MSPQNLYVEILIPNVMGFWRQSLWEAIRSVGALMNGFSTLTRDGFILARTEGKESSVNQEVRLHQTPNLLEP